MTPILPFSPILIAGLLHPAVVNAVSLGPDLFTLPSSRSLLELDAALIANAPSSFSFGNPAVPIESFLGAGGGIGKGLGVFKEGLHAASKKELSPPDVRTLLRKEALQWTVENKRPLGEGAYVKALASRIRDELQKVVASEEITSVARQIALCQPIYVRIAPTDGSLENYGIEVFASQPPDINYRQVQWRLDLKTGQLEPLELKSHAVYLVRAQAQGPEGPQGFIPFYRTIRFVSRALRAEPLLLTLPETQRRQLMNVSTPVAPRGPGMLTRLRGLFDAVAAEQPTRVLETKSVLVRYIPKVRAGIAQEVEDYFAVNESLTEEGRRFIRRLTNDVLSELYRRECADPSHSRWSCLWVWLRRNEGEEYGHFELLTPDQMLDHPPRENDLLFMLVRDDEAMKTDFMGLVHVYNRSHMVGNMQRPIGADLAFEAFLGLGPADKFTLRLKHLQRSPRDLTEWDRWMVENGQWKKRT